jgi:hypothetical protein
MEHMCPVLITLFLSLAFCGYGNDSLVRVNTTKFFSQKLLSKSPVYRNILLTDTKYHFPVITPSFNNSSNFQLYTNRKPATTSPLKFQYYVAKNETGIFLVNKGKPGTQVFNKADSLFKASNIPLLRNENAGVWKKIGRAELIIGSVELFSMSVLIMMPKEVTKWSHKWAQDALRNLKRSFSTAPVWDKDGWKINYIGHPVAGSYYYNSLRSQNANWFHSFLFATAQSCIWEYVIEGMAEKPSTQDLFVTPIGGIILGEATHQLTMNMRRNGFNFFEKLFVLIFNPMFVINNGFGPKFNLVRMKN